MKIYVMLFKIWKCMLEIVHQTGPKFSPTYAVPIVNALTTLHSGYVSVGNTEIEDAVSKQQRERVWKRSEKDRTIQNLEIQTNTSNQFQKKKTATTSCVIETLTNQQKNSNKSEKIYQTQREREIARREEWIISIQ